MKTSAVRWTTLYFDISKAVHPPLWTSLDLHQCTKYPGKKLPETLETCHFANGLISLISSLWLHLLSPPCGKRRYIDINRKYNSSLHVRHRFIYRFNSMTWKGYCPHNCLMLRCVSAYCGLIWILLDVMVGFERKAGTSFCPINVDVWSTLIGLIF